MRKGEKGRGGGRGKRGGEGGDRKGRREAKEERRERRKEEERFNPVSRDAVTFQIWRNSCRSKIFMCRARNGFW
jgi:hypothetical protein